MDGHLRRVSPEVATPLSRALQGAAGSHGSGGTSPGRRSQRPADARTASGGQRVQSDDVGRDPSRRTVAAALASGLGCRVRASHDRVLLFGLPLLLPLYLVLNLTVQTVHVVGSAMEPTFRNGDYLVADKLAYVLRAPARGDVAILRDPSDPARDLIKRVVGLPGERVLVSGCAVFVNGRRLAEPYVRVWSDCNPSWPARGQPQLLASDEFFMMGDNRDHSRDSRQLGPIRRDLIEAQVRVSRPCSGNAFRTNVRAGLLRVQDQWRPTGVATNDHDLDQETEQVVEEAVEHDWGSISARHALRSAP